MKKFAEPLVNESKIISYLKDKPTSVVNPPIKNELDGDNVTITQKAIYGGDFFDYISNSNRSILSAIAFLKCIRDSLIYFGEHKIIFNDFAQNIMMKNSDDLDLALVDFGCSRIC